MTSGLSREDREDRPTGHSPLVFDGTEQRITPMLPKPTPVFDPNNEPVRVVDHITLHPMAGQHHDFTFCTCTYVPRLEGEFDHVPVVTARIRITSDMARAIVSGLSQQLAMMEIHGQPKN